MILIGLTGKAGSGKDTVGEILKNKYTFALTSFAVPIKKAICAMLNTDIDIWDNREWRETVLPAWGVTPRYLAQTIGTEWGREMIKDTLWLDLALARIEKMNYDFDRADMGDFLNGVAITDVRFENEAHHLRELGGHIIHVDRGLTDTKTADHTSESGIEIKGLDFVVHNDGTLEDLEKRVDEIYIEVRDEEV